MQHCLWIPDSRGTIQNKEEYIVRRRYVGGPGSFAPRHLDDRVLDLGHGLELEWRGERLNRTVQTDAAELSLAVKTVQATSTVLASGGDATTEKQHAGAQT
jgi:hypothetical protein